MTTTLVFGATGNVGRPLVRSLVSKGLDVRAASRSGEPVEGTQGVVFDFATPETLSGIFDGVAQAYLLLPSGYVKAKALLMPVIDAAKENGVKLVFQSVFGADASDDIPYRQVEIALEKSGLAYVILRPNWFLDNFHSFWKTGIDHGVIALPAGDGKSSFIDARDIAACAEAALTSSQFDGKAFNLTGPAALSYAEAATVLSETLGRSIRYDAISDEGFVDMLTGSGVPGDYAQFLAGIFYSVREGWTSAVTGDVETLTGAKPRSISQYANDHLALLKALTLVPGISRAV